MASGSEQSDPASSLEERVAAALAAEELEVVAVEGEIAELAAKADRRLADRCRALVELVAPRAAIAVEQLQRRQQTFVRVHDSLTRLGQHASVDAIIRSAPAEAAAACDLDRVVIYRVDGDGLLAESFYVRDDPDQAAELLAFSRDNPLELRQDILETELIRRRLPMVVRDAFNHPNTWKPFIERYQTFSYVAAPIAPEGRVIGFAHADKAVQKPGDRNGVDEFDRDVLWAFAEGLGYAIERMQLLERLQAQGQEVRRLIAQTESVVAEWLCEPCGEIYDPVGGDLEAGIPPGTAFEDMPDSWLCPVCGARKGDFVPMED